MNSKADAKSSVLQMSDASLRRHFILLAEDANRLGDTHLAEHFLEIAMEMFDEAAEASDARRVNAATGRPRRNLEERLSHSRDYG